MLAEAIEIIPALHTGEMTTFDGDYFRVDSGVRGAAYRSTAPPGGTGPDDRIGETNASFCGSPDASVGGFLGR